MDVKRLLSPETPRGPLSWSVLGVVILLTLIMLWSAWAITESQAVQWAVVVMALFVWNFFLIQAGERGTGQLDTKLSSQTAIVLFLCGIAMLALAGALTTASEDWALYPGRETIYYVLISVPIMILANLYLSNRQE